jgi:hypothetical protein
MQRDPDAVLSALAALDGVSLGSGSRGFGSDSLCVQGRIFAIPRSDGLVLKLPAARVAELIASGEGSPFDAGKGKPMREWIVLGKLADDRALALGKEALAFVGGGSSKHRRAT